MFLTFWCVLSLTLAALLMGTTFSHMLQMAPKLSYGGTLWLQVQQSLYRVYASVGGIVEAASIISAFVLAWLLRDWRPALLAALAGAICLAVAFFVIWIMVTNKVNARTAKWSPPSLPEDWRRWRKRWEISHALRFALHLTGFVLLVLATLVSPLADD